MSSETFTSNLVRVAVAPTAAKLSLSRRRLAVIALGFATLAGLWYGEQWWTAGRFVESTDDAYVGGDVTAIAPHVAGFVAQILVKDNQYVRAGQPLVRLDARDFQAALDRAAATLNQRRADLASLQARDTLQDAVIRQAQADLVAKQAAARFASEDAVRYATLARVAYASRQDNERAQAATQSAQATVVAANAAVDAAKLQRAVLDSQIAGAKAAEAQAEADLTTAQLDVGYTEINAPVDGYVGNRAAQVGAYITAGTELLSVVPAKGLWVDANFKEDQLAHMRPGQPATIVADVLSGRVFHGHVISLAPATGAVFSVIPPQNATGNFTKIVQRVPVRIVLDSDDATLGLLRPGLSTTVSVDTRRAP